MQDIPQTINEALSYWAEKTPEKTFIHCRENTYSYRKTKEITSNLAGFLADKGIPTGARICLLLPRTPELIFSFLAATATGLIPSPVNYLESNDTIQKIIESVTPSVIVVDNRLITEKIKDFITKCDAIVISVNRKSTSANSLHWDDCVQKTMVAEKQPDSGPHDLAYLNFTTGSSGFPKGALCTHANLTWNSRSAIETFSLTEADVHLCMFASFAHPHELFCRALYTGASLVLLTEINPKTIIRTINRYHVTCMMGLAVMYKMMAEYSKKTLLPSLRIAESGGMYTSPEIHTCFLASFNLPILSVWGSTETSGIALANTPADHRLDGSMGKACPHYLVKVIDHHDKEVQTGTIGELIFSSPALVSSYHNTPSFPCKNGWYYSGDLAFVDEEGFYHFVERKSGMIKVAGLKVYPLQVELTLQHHPKIKEIAIIGISDKRRGFVPKAYIVAQNDAIISIDDLRTYCENKLPAYMVPKQIQHLTSLPKIGSGKIDKKALSSL